jgi:hypothetical protein
MSSLISTSWVIHRGAFDNYKVMQFHVFYRFQTLGRFLIMCGNIEGYGRINGKSFSYLFWTSKGVQHIFWTKVLFK